MSILNTLLNFVTPPEHEPQLDILFKELIQTDFRIPDDNDITEKLYHNSLVLKTKNYYIELSKSFFSTQYDQGAIYYDVWNNENYSWNNKIADKIVEEMLVKKIDNILLENSISKQQKEERRKDIKRIFPL